jgi:hypothetical protein
LATAGERDPPHAARASGTSARTTIDALPLPTVRRVWAPSPKRFDRVAIAMTSACLSERDPGAVAKSFFRSVSKHVQRSAQQVDFCKTTAQAPQ